MLASEAGPLFGRHTLAIAWKGTDGKVFANERRELTAYDLPGGTMIDFASELTTTLPKVRLDGDPQHAGFHFRANMEVSQKDVAKQTYYLRPDGPGKPGTMTGGGEVKRVRIDPSVVDPAEVDLLEDLVLAALHDAAAKAQAIQSEAMGPLAGLGLGESGTGGSGDLGGLGGLLGDAT